MQPKWMTEPSFHEWTTAVGLRAFMRRHSTALHWCVYVEVPHTHPGYHDYAALVSYADEIPEEHKTTGMSTTHCGPPIHGGDPAIPWVFGIDFAHLGQLSPGTLQHGARYSHHYERYIDLDEAMSHGEALARVIRKQAPAVCSKMPKPKRVRCRKLDRSKCKRGPSYLSYEGCSFIQYDDLCPYPKRFTLKRTLKDLAVLGYPETPIVSRTIINRCARTDKMPCAGHVLYSASRCERDESPEVEGNCFPKGKKVRPMKPWQERIWELHIAYAYGECDLDKRCWSPEHSCSTNGASSEAA